MNIYKCILVDHNVVEYGSKALVIVDLYHVNHVTNIFMVIRITTE